jgi:hypothetical protein
MFLRQTIKNKEKGMIISGLLITTGFISKLINQKFISYRQSNHPFKILTLKSQTLKEIYLL